MPEVPTMSTTTDLAELRDWLRGGVKSNMELAERYGGFVGLSFSESASRFSRWANAVDEQTAHFVIANKVAMTFEGFCKTGHAGKDTASEWEALMEAYGEWRETCKPADAVEAAMKGSDDGEEANETQAAG